MSLLETLKAGVSVTDAIADSWAVLCLSGRFIDQVLLVLVIDTKVVG
jgi:hypothetical protein